MGAHHAPHSSSHATRLAGRGAFTAAAALALAGGTASLAFASPAPHAPSTQDIKEHVSQGSHEVQDAAKSSPFSKVSHTSAHDVSSSMKEHASDTQDKASHAASTLKSKAPSSLPSAPSLSSAPSFSSVPSAPSSLPISDMATDTGHALSNAGVDASHARTNWAAAAKDGLTSHEASEQFGLMKNDLTHAVDNGKADVTHWGSALGGSAPQSSLLSFS
ncbi:hypothetical protein [Actinomycetospora sp. TBRC 11914]|uniref:hypothetical protein n=1 Tax=Actinomycetospora sp. TBRC 11914 TaxID=2729387 RepID=UPI00145DA142|nr:hypothetical protein [Actinomycetospora sp. TBRC 11914]NMO91204.1 hypothetical protein [Actinomycetospora sp. TBRC 11914]